MSFCSLKKDNVCLLHLYPPVIEKATVALYFRRILTHLGVSDFQVFRVLFWRLPSSFAACSKPPSRYNCRKALIQEILS